MWHKPEAYQCLRVHQSLLCFTSLTRAILLGFNCPVKVCNQKIKLLMSNIFADLHKKYWVKLRINN